MNQKLGTFRKDSRTLKQETDCHRRSFGKIGIFLGGTSRERPISLRSGKAVFQALQEADFDVILIDTAESFLPLLKRRAIDTAFIALHGSGGEDGTLQKLLDRFRIPYVGSSANASLRAFDKARAKKFFLRSGIPTAPFQMVTRGNWKKAVKVWEPPYVIKPTREGSSIGIFFVENKKQAPQKVEAGLKRYPSLLFEKKIEGREFTIGILGDEALPVIELKTKRAFYDYTAKYTKGLTEYLIPAPIPAEWTQRLQTIALKAHRALKLRDLSRVDFMMTQTGEPYVLEINSIPGFTETSLLPKAARSIGIDFTELCTRLLEIACARRQQAREKVGECV